MIHAITWMNFKVYRVKETSLKGYTLYDSIYTRDGEFIRGCQGIEVKGGCDCKRIAQRGCFGTLMYPDHSGSKLNIYY